MRDLTARFANFRPSCLFCNDDFDSGGYDEESSLLGDLDANYQSTVPTSVLTASPVLSPTPSSGFLLAGPDTSTPFSSGAPSTSGTIIPAPSSGGLSSMTLLEQLGADAAKVTNNAIIENANPYNNAIITNQPIAVGPQEITPPTASHSLLAIGLIVLAGLGGYAILRKK